MISELSLFQFQFTLVLHRTGQGVWDILPDVLTEVNVGHPSGCPTPQLYQTSVLSTTLRPGSKR